MKPVIIGASAAGAILLTQQLKLQPIVSYVLVGVIVAGVAFIV